MTSVHESAQCPARRPEAERITGESYIQTTRRLSFLVRGTSARSETNTASHRNLVRHNLQVPRLNGIRHPYRDAERREAHRETLPLGRAHDKTSRPVWAIRLNLDWILRESILYKSGSRGRDLKNAQSSPPGLVVAIPTEVKTRRCQSQLPSELRISHRRQASGPRSGEFLPNFG